MNRRLLAAALLISTVLAGCSAKPVVETETAPETEHITETTKLETTKAETEPSTIESFPGTADDPTANPPEPVYTGGCKILVASDIHYLSKNLTDLKGAFQYMVDHDDGKAMPYIWEITDAFIEKVVEEKPDVLIISGDLTFNGEKDSHLDIAGKLKEIESAGVPVIVIPGNHDINNMSASQFLDEHAMAVSSILPEEFEAIYDDYGYSEAVSRDPASLSYVYQINDYTRAMMLDTCQYEPYSQMGGMIQEGTYDWIEEQMDEAWRLGMNVIPVAHHNLLDESEVYVKDYTIEHSAQLIDQLESWDVPLFLSGHLHVQHFMRSGEDYGIYEIVTSSVATPPCQYGVLYYGDDASFRYHTEALDMEKWAQDNGSTDENLLNFKEFGVTFTNRVFYNQAQDEFAENEDKIGLSKTQRDLMAKLYGELNTYYYNGKVYEIRDKALERPGFQLWDELGYPSILAQHLESVVDEGTVDYNVLEAE